MRSSLFAKVAFLSLAALGRANDDCDAADAPFATTSRAGPEFPSDGNLVFCESKWTAGETIIGIEAWAAKFQVKGIRFKYSQSGWTDTYGSVDDYVRDSPYGHASIEWEPSDEIGIRLWENKPDDGKEIDAVGRIIVTRGGQEVLNVGGAHDKVQKTEIPVNAGGGKIMGVKGRGGPWLGAIEFKMLRAKVEKTEILEINFPKDISDWNKDQDGMSTASLADVWYGNKNAVGGPNLTFSFANTVSKDFTKTITTTRTHTWTGGVTVTVSSGLKVPFLVEGKIDVAVKAEYSYQRMKSTATAESDKKDLTWSMGSPFSTNLLAPQMAVHCTAWAITGVFDSDYTSKVKATLGDGSTVIYNDIGHFNSVGYSTASSDCEQMSLDKAPENADLLNPAEVDGTKETRAVRAHPRAWKLSNLWA